MRDSLLRAALGTIAGALVVAALFMLVPMALGALGFGVVAVVERLCGVGRRKPKRLDDLSDL